MLRPHRGVSQAEGSGGTRALPLLHLLVPGCVPRKGGRVPLHSGAAGFPCNLGGERPLEEAVRAVKVVFPGCLTAHFLSHLRLAPSRCDAKVLSGTAATVLHIGGEVRVCLLPLFLREQATSPVTSESVSSDVWGPPSLAPRAWPEPGLLSRHGVP